MCKILHVRATNFFGGPEKQIVGHIITSKNTNQSILTFFEGGKKNEFFEKCKNEGIPAEYIATKNSFNPSSILKLRSQLKKIQPDIICTHGYKPAILSLFSRIGFGIPIIMFVRGHTGENVKVRLFEAIEIYILRFADCIISVSHGYAEYLLRRGVKRDRIRIVQNAINLFSINGSFYNINKKRIELGFSAQDILIATAGRLSPEKAQTDLILAFSKVQSIFQKAKLLILGEGPLKKELQILVQSLNLQNVYFLGFRKDIYEIMSLLDLFVLSSLTEGLPNVILEAFACKKPVVATSVGGVPEVVENGINGILVMPHKPDELAEAIIALINSPDSRQKMGVAGYNRIKNDFTFEAQTAKLEEVYREVLEKRKR
jgi:glycosyltransferase involved in cell wall biosynthesis